MKGKTAKWKQGVGTPHPFPVASPRAAQLEDRDLPAAVMHLTALSDLPIS